MKHLNLLFVLCTIIVMASCTRNPNSVWEDTKTASRHMGRGVRALGGKHGDSRQINSRDQFMGSEDSGEYYVDSTPSDYIPLTDDPNIQDISIAEMVCRPPRETPGDPGCKIPGIEAFRDPSMDPKLAATFRNITFPYNSTLVKGDNNMQTVRNVADYMKSNPNVYIFVEGHCDERGPESYNLALGSHRANAVRNLLVNDGVNPDHIFTISYGKERPLIFGHDEESWEQNRRAEFKVYER